ncbi:MAG: phosphoglycerate mutase family protein [Deltaproteobacteria bacterium]
MNEPSSILLVRHARSLANADPRVYQTMPDHAIPLCAPDDDPGALEAGAAIAGLGMPAEAVSCWRSSYLRCQQTEQLVMGRAFGPTADRLTRLESYLLREQEYGDWDGLSDAQIAARDAERWSRKQQAADGYGRFYFRNPNGESRADVVQRMAVFIEHLRRSGTSHHVVFAHAITLRAFRMAWFHHSIEWFDGEPNPPNAAVLHLARDGGRGAWVERSIAPRTG